VTIARLAIRVSGRVQGVGFRFFTRNTAEGLGITGWVSNTGDGAVEAEAQGGPKLLQDFIKDLRKGPPLGHVTCIAQGPCAVRDDCREFRIRYGR
jgi:acylphosphatase